MHRCVASLCLAAVLALPAAAQEIRNDIYYRLSTELRGPEMPLGLQIGGALDRAAELEKTENVSSQFWRVQHSVAGKVRLTTMFLGPQMCLDVIAEGDRRNEAELRPCAEAPGQRWGIEVEGNGYRLTSAANGRVECLDVIDEGEGKNRLTLRDCGFYASQFWTFTPTDQRAD